MNKFWLGLAVVLAAALLLGGCGGSKTKAPAPAAEQAAQAAPPPPPAAVPPPPAAAAPPAQEPVVTEPKEMDREPVTEPPPKVAVTEPPPIEEPPRVEAAPPPQVAEQAPPATQAVPVVEAPPQPMAAAPEYGVVYFDFDKYNIKSEFEGVIKENAQRLSANGTTVIVEGHCDERGTTEYNLALGERRAKAVRDALVQRGVDAGHLQIVSYGEERPLSMGHDESSWSQNRRSVLTTK